MVASCLPEGQLATQPFFECRSKGSLPLDGLGDAMWDWAGFVEGVALVWAVDGWDVEALGDGCPWAGCCDVGLGIEAVWNERAS